MRVMVALENRFLKTRNGNIYSGTLCDYGFWKRYLQVFDEVVVFARVDEIPESKLDKPPANGPKVTFFSLPTFIGPRQYLVNYAKLRKIAKQATNKADAFILRIPGTIGTMLWKELRRKKMPFAVEVVGSSRDSAETCGASFLLKTILKRTWPRAQRLQCKNAIAVSYITANYLQRLYPPGGWSISCSDVDLPDAALVCDNRLHQRYEALNHTTGNEFPFRLCHAGTMNALYKAQDVLIEAVSICNSRGFNLELILLGEGRYQRYFEDKAKILRIKSKVNFLGQLPPGERVREQLDKADLCVFPSLTEGQGRVLIEAMARGLPCIGSNIGGIPELLPEQYLVEPGNAEKLAEKIMSVIVNTDELKKMASRNLQKAKEYRLSELNKRRIEFYKKVAEATKDYLTSGRNN